MLTCTVTNSVHYQLNYPNLFSYRVHDVSLPSRKKQQLMKKIQSYQSDIKTVKQARVALVGRVGAGKSSFFNSISSTFRGNMTSQAIAGTAASSVTTQVPAQDLWPFRGA